MKEDISDAIRIGIEKEHEAYTLYTTLSKDPKIPSLSKLFVTLAVQELRHERLLKKILEVDDFERAKEESTLEYEKELDILSTIDPDVSIVDAVSGIALAIKREKAAYDAYIDLASRADSQDAQDIFEMLAGEEQKHKDILEKEMGKLLDKR